VLNAACLKLSGFVEHTVTLCVCTYLFLTFCSFSSSLSFLILLHTFHFPQIFPYIYLGFFNIFHAYIAQFYTSVFTHFPLFSLLLLNFLTSDFSRLFIYLFIYFIFLFFCCFTSPSSCPIQKALNEQAVDS
jgi:hypothetical protein